MLNKLKNNRKRHRYFYFFASILLAVFVVYYFTSTQQIVDDTRVKIISQKRRQSKNDVPEFRLNRPQSTPTNRTDNLTTLPVKANSFIEISPGNHAFLAITDRRNEKADEKNVLLLLKEFLLPRVTNDDQALWSIFQNNSEYPGKVRILMAVTRDQGFSCQFSDGTKVPGEMVLLNIVQSTKKLYYMFCHPPMSMSLESIEEIRIWDEQSQTSAVVPISYKIQDETAIPSFSQIFAICIPLLYGKKYSAKDFIEFMEVNRLLGVDQISIYTNGSLNEKLKMVMEGYAKEGFLEIIPFSIPFNPADIHYHGQYVTITDCLLRHNGRTEFVSFQDLDEYAVPIAKGIDGSVMNRLTLIPKLFSSKNRASLRLKVNYIFPKIPTPPITLNNHEQIEIEDGRVTKCIVRPHYALEPFIHHADSFIRKRYFGRYLSTKQMVILHYKDKEATIQRLGGEKETNTNYYFSNHFPNISRVFNAKCKQFDV